MTVVVHAANIQDRDGAKLVLEKMRGKFPWLTLLWAEGGYAGKLIEWVQDACGKSSNEATTFKDSSCFRDEGSWSEPSLGSVVADGSAKTTRSRPNQAKP